MRQQFLKELKAFIERVKLTFSFYKSLKNPEHILTWDLNTNYYTRRDWIKLKLSQLQNGKLIDVGAGQQEFRQDCKHLSYTSQDFCQYEPNKEQTGLHVENWNYTGIDIVSDITSIPVEARSFDYALCTEVFEHLQEPTGALKEINRVLKVGGKLIITAPFCSMTHFAPYFYYSGFSKYFYTTVCKNYGFELEEIEPNGNYLDYLSQELTRVETADLSYLDFSQYELEFIKRTKSMLIEKRAKFKDKDLMAFGYHAVLRKSNDL
jgi:SAM-dependent methyltransferase